MITDIDIENILGHFGAVQENSQTTYYNGECYFDIGNLCDKRKLSSAD